MAETHYVLNAMNEGAILISLGRSLEGFESTRRATELLLHSSAATESAVQPGEIRASPVGQTAVANVTDTASAFLRPFLIMNSSNEGPVSTMALPILVFNMGVAFHQEMLLSPSSSTQDQSREILLQKSQSLYTQALALWEKVFGMDNRLTARHFDPSLLHVKATMLNNMIELELAVVGKSRQVVHDLKERFRAVYGAIPSKTDCPIHQHLERAFLSYVLEANAAQAA